MAGKVVEFCENNEGFSDVLDIVRPLCDTEEKDTNEELDESKEKYGFVYLMKSGKYHKIGRSDNVGRRKYELGTKLPQKLEVIHEIMTDDPIGVEVYWHNRFEDKRAEGEWFKLNSNDVKKFKKWKRIL